jgi:replicative DNA helicase
MTPEQAEEFAKELYNGHPAAPALLLTAFHGSKEEAVRVMRALKILVPEAPADAPHQLPWGKKNVRQLWEGVRGAIESLDRYDVGDFSDRLSLGMPKLDRRLRGGLGGGRMYLIGAPTGGGKSSLVMQIAGAGSLAGSVLVVSPEMSLESLVEREIIREGRAPEWDRRPDDWIQSDVDRSRKESARQAHTEAANRILNEKRPVYVLDQPDATMADIERAAAAIDDLQLVVIDYAQQVAGDGSADDRARYLQVGEVALRSVAMSLKHNVPVVVASQVNTIEEKGRTRYAFRESKILEQKAHAIMIIEVKWWEDENNAEERLVQEAYVICTKNRSGPTFKLRIEYQPHIYLMSDYHPPFTGGSFRGGALPPAVPED